MTRSALFAAMLIGNACYYVFLSGTFEHFFYSSTGAAGALFLHWIFNR